ncbi:MAG: hypothetical protein LBV79_05085 [Candidatus Adiutrix sp.]|jgi:YHS domain-containing protein|nr:hypothetical protein [Candidatus Adiutrix sp.]
MFSKKGKRKIVVGGQTYYWCVTEESDAGIDLQIQVFSESKHLFSHYVKLEVVERVPVSEIAWRVIYEEPPQITPSFIEKLIVERTAGM